MSKRQGIMLCYPYEQRRFDRWGGKAIIQKKLNGERCRITITSDGPVLWSSEAHKVPFLPHIEDSIKALHLGVGMELDGELYVHGMLKDDIHSIVSRKVNPHPNAHVMEYHIFDVVTDLTTSDRMIMVKSIGGIIRRKEIPSINIVFPEEVSSYKEIDSFLDEAIEEGYEGFVLRKLDTLYIRQRTPAMMKFKPTEKDVYPIIGSVEEVSITGEPKNALGAIICQSDDGTPFNVGTGFSRQQRNDLWQQRSTLLGKFLVVKYQAKTARGIPVPGVAVQVLDLSDAKDDPS